MTYRYCTVNGNHRVCLPFSFDNMPNRKKSPSKRETFLDQSDRNRRQKQQQRQRRVCFSILSLTLLCMSALSNIERYGNSKHRSGRRKKAEDAFVCGEHASVTFAFLPKRCAVARRNMLSDIFMTGLKAFQKNATYSISHCRRSGTIQNVLFGKPWRRQPHLAWMNNNTTTLQWMHRTFVRHARRFGHTRVHTA